MSLDKLVGLRQLLLGRGLTHEVVKTVANDTLLLTVIAALLARRLSEESNTKVIGDAPPTVLDVEWQVQCEFEESAARRPEVEFDMSIKRSVYDMILN